MAITSPTGTAIFSKSKNIKIKSEINSQILVINVSAKIFVFTNPDDPTNNTG